MDSNRLHLPTLQQVKFEFALYSDHSCQTHGYRRLCEMIKQQELLEEKERQVGESCPDWLTPDVRCEVRRIWESHIDHNDNHRVEAARFLILKAQGQKDSIHAGFGRALYLIKMFCLK